MPLFVRDLPTDNVGLPTKTLADSKRFRAGDLKCARP